MFIFSDFFHKYKHTTYTHEHTCIHAQALSLTHAHTKSLLSSKLYFYSYISFKLLKKFIFSTNPPPISQSLCLSLTFFFPSISMSFYFSFCVYNESLEKQSVVCVCLCVYMCLCVFVHITHYFIRVVYMGIG